MNLMFWLLVSYVLSLVSYFMNIMQIGEQKSMNEILNWFWFFAGFGVGWAFCLIISLLFGGEGEN